MKSTNPLSSLLRGSPFEPIQKHMQVVSECVAQIPLLIEALIAGDKTGLETAIQEIDVLETKADEKKNDFRFHLPSTLFMPVSRRDLLRLISEQDNVADTAEMIAKLFNEREMIVPAALVDQLRELTSVSVEALGQASKVINQLDELLEVGFGGKQSVKVIEMIGELRHLEHKNDAILTSINRALFKIEDDLKPVDVVFWYRAFELLGRISNKAENVGDRVLLVIAK
ncbi:MAG: putative phosphate transport protein (TIGR00153 family) [Verrucomicrobiales bacterium]|jgi:predicted phosphate transport protein (TIGR00153 family)